MAANTGVDRLGTYAKVTRVLLVMQIGVGILLAVINSILLYYAASSPTGTFYASGLPPQTMFVAMFVSGLLGLLTLLLVLLTALFFMLWVHCAWSNLYEAGVDSLNYSPAWAVGSFFVPFVNLVIPPRSMREMANRSAGEDVWQSMQPVGDVTSWWSFLLAGAFLRLIVVAVGAIGRIPYLYVTTPIAATMGLSVFATILLAGSAWFLRRVIAQVTADQKAMRHASGAFA